MGFDADIAQVLVSHVLADIFSDFDGEDTIAVPELQKRMAKEYVNYLHELLEWTLGQLYSSEVLGDELEVTVSGHKYKITRVE